MTVGFTGTRAGLSKAQREQFVRVLGWLARAGFDTFCHGAAVGADAEAAQLAEQCDYVLSPRPAAGDPLARNRQIVADSHILVAAPRSDREALRSGTWATVRYARAARLPVVFLARGTETER